MNDVEIIEKLTETIERNKSDTHQIEEIKNDVKEIKQDQKAIYELASSIKIIANDLGTIKTDITEVKLGQNMLSSSQIELSCKMDKEINCVKSELTEVKTQEDVKKGKKWDKIAFEIIKYISLLGIGGVITYVLSK